MTATLLIGLFILGIIFGSLGSVLITRLAHGVNISTLKGIFFGFSQCPQCKKRLKAKNLIPVASYFLQKGRCEHCHKRIPKFYPILEILSGLVFITTYRVIGDVGGGMVIFRILINRLFLLMIVYDFQKYELHVPLWFLTLGVALLPQFFFDFGNYTWAFFGSLILGGICLLIYYFSKWYVNKRYKTKDSGFGEGDIMMGFLLGTLFPYIFIYQNIAFSPINILSLIVLFFILSSVLGLIWYLIPQGKTTNSPITYTNKFIAFIPFMIFAYWILLVSGLYFIRLLFPGG